MLGLGGGCYREGPAGDERVMMLSPRMFQKALESRAVGYRAVFWNFLFSDSSSARFLPPITPGKIAPLNLRASEVPGQRQANPMSHGRVGSVSITPRYRNR